MFEDLRSFIDRLDSEGELLRVRCEVDWRYEVSGWIRRCYDMKPPGPALLFENIKDYAGYSLFANGLGTYRRFALALGMPLNSSPKDIVLEFKRRCEKPIEPVLVSSGPCKENILVGDKVNLLKFPVPYWHPRDGGRYIGTWHGVVSKDPETGERNVGMYRMMVIDETRTCIGFLPFSHLGIHYAKAEEMGKPLPVAVTIGAEEYVPIAAATPFPAGVDEYKMAGALKKAPIKLVKCETVDLEVPASSEIVLEGELLPKERVEEGPFGEHTGYHGGPVRMRPIFKVKCITHRSNPILRGTYLGKPVDENNMLTHITNSAEALRLFETYGIKGVKAVNCPAFGAAWLSAIIQMKPYYVGHTWDVAHTFIGSNLARHCKITILVDEDIDPFDIEQVWWALTTRVQGSRDIEVLRFQRTSRSDPSAPRDAPEITDKVIIDATKKLDYPYIPAYGSTWAPVAYPPEEIMKIVELRWKTEIEGKKLTEEEAKHLQQLKNRVKELESEWEEKRQSIKKMSEEEREKEKHRSYPRRT